jgi:4-hydroxybenzoate polyprenyltransferase
VSSAVYCINDVVDRDADAEHPQKQDRPLPSGRLQPRDAVVTAVVLMLGAAALLGATGLRWQVPAIAGAYLAMNVLYSIWLKHLALIDVLVIAAGFVLRLVAGTFAVEVEPTSWIVLTTGLGSMLLAFGKRRGDLEAEQSSRRASLAGYSLPFIDQALAIMAASTIVVYALYTVSSYAQDRFDAPLLYLTTFPVVAGILRYLQTVMVHGRYGSPTDLALHDRPLQLAALVWIAMFAFFVYA